jgi:hypothetical protein
MPTRELRDLTPPIAASLENPHPWKMIGGDRSHVCNFCGKPSSAVVGCPDEDAPVVWQIGVCDDCLTDCVMVRFAAVKHQRMMALAKDMHAAADAIVKLRTHAQWTKRDPAELRAEELAIREKHGLLEGTPLHDVTRRGSPLL